MRRVELPVEPLGAAWVQVSSQLRDHVDVMRAALPVVQALRNPALKDRHWHKIAAILRQPVHIEPIPTFSDLLELKVRFTQQLRGPLFRHVIRKLSGWRLALHVGSCD